MVIIYSIFLQVVEVITGELSSNSKVYIWDGKGKRLFTLNLSVAKFDVFSSSISQTLIRIWDI